MAFDPHDVATPAAVGLIAWVGSFFAHGFKFGGRLARIETQLESLGERINAHANADAEAHKATRLELAEQRGRIDRILEGH